MPEFEPITVIIPFHSNESGLAVTLVSLQAQLVPPKAIIIIDTSPTKRGLSIAKRYTTNNVPIVVEVAEVGIYEAWNKGLEIAGEGDVVIINDDLLLPMNFIDILQVSRRAVPGLAYVPVTPSRDHAAPNVNGEFPWYCPVPETVDDFAQTDWLPGFCFMLTKEAVREIGPFDLRFKVWYGDTDYQQRLLVKGREMKLNPIVLIKSLYAYHYGGSSYHYTDKTTVRKIGKDRRRYLSKYKQDG